MSFAGIKGDSFDWLSYPPSYFCTGISEQRIGHEKKDGHVVWSSVSKDHGHSGKLVCFSISFGYHVYWQKKKEKKKKEKKERKMCTKLEIIL